MKPEDWVRLERMLDDRLRILLRAETATGKATGHDNLRDLRARLDRIERALGSGQ